MTAFEVVTVWAIPSGTHYHRSKSCVEAAARGMWEPTEPDQDWLRALKPCENCSSDTKLAVVRQYA